jgi:hypothetical protein
MIVAEASRGTARSPIGSGVDDHVEHSAIGAAHQLRFTRPGAPDRLQIAEKSQIAIMLMTRPLLGNNESGMPAEKKGETA